ncbi:MAG: insulinase family protein [Holosporales bacterium]|jgi:zinc protease|nr:insulinase family protein [Holosporales bacterium]
MMKNKGIKIAIISILLGAVFYMLKSIGVFKEDVEPEKISLLQSKLSISEIESESKCSIWSIKTENPTIAYSIIFKNEGSKNFKDYPGILHIIDNTLLEGAGDRDASELKQTIIDNNIRISVDFGNDKAVVSVYTISNNFDFSIDIVSDILTKAHLNPQKLEINKQKALMELKQSKFIGRLLADSILSQEMFDKNHPYHRNIDEYIKKIPTYTKKDVDVCYKKLFASEDAIITVASPLNEEILYKGFTRLLKNLSSVKKNNFEDGKQEITFKNMGKSKHVELDTSQTSIVFVLPGVPKDSPDRFAFRFANMILGDHNTFFVNRLVKDIREERGLTYGIGTLSSNLDLFSGLYGYADTSPENVQKLIERTRVVLKELVEKGITKDELEYHKIAYYSRHTIASAQGIVEFVNSCRMDNIQVKYVNNYLRNYLNLSLEEVNRVIKKYYHPDKILFVTVGRTVNKNKEKTVK